MDRDAKIIELLERVLREIDDLESLMKDVREEVRTVKRRLP